MIPSSLLGEYQVDIHSTDYQYDKYHQEIRRMENWSEDAFAAYIAALIDGEGNLQVLKVHQKYEVPRIRISNSVKFTLDAMVARLGYGQVKLYDQRANKLGKKPVYQLEFVSVENVIKLLEFCGKYIHMKRDKSQQLLQLAYETIERREQNHQSKRMMAEEVRRLLDSGLSQNLIAERLGICQATVSAIKNQKRSYGTDQAIRRDCA